MSTPNHDQVGRIFAEASALPEDRRAAYLEEACGGDTGLRAQVESLLAHDAQAGADFLASGRQPIGPVADENDPDITTPRSADDHPMPAGGPRIEGYEILRELHRGGQGVVFQAIQKSTKRKVAIKVLLDGPFAGRAALRRFEREIELVAHLRHPHIVEVFHSGTTADGRQYFVMDYVRGVPLDRFVREKKLPMDQALRLFGKVCEAVNYAHQRGVIHRDLKPSNILVDSEGEPKVLDFGLAKQLSGPDETLVSITGQVVGTLPYLSPEQARGNPNEVDTRTDVYALGVMLYEILTGQYPYPVVGQMADVLRHIAETQPTPPSRTWKSGTGVDPRADQRMRLGACPIDNEVQTIVLRSLAKERDRRYQSAGELANDVTHYLAGEPIGARKDSGWYMVKKLAGRHRKAVAIISSFVVMLVSALVVISVIAKQKSLLAIKEKKERLAAINATNAALAAKSDAERSRDERDRAFKEAEARRIIALANATLPDNPARALLCAIAGAEAASKFPTSAANTADLAFASNSALADALDTLLEVKTFVGHTDRVKEVAFVPNSGKLLSISLDNTARLWDCDQERSPLTLKHDVGILCMAISRDGRRIVTGGNDRSARVWDTSTGKLMFPPLMHGNDKDPHLVLAAAISPDGSKAATATYTTIYVWDLTTGRLVGEPHPIDQAITITRLLFTPDGTGLVASSLDGFVRLWSIDSFDFKVLISPPRESIQPSDDRLVWCDMSRDGNSVAACTGSDPGKVCVWSAGKGRAWEGQHRWCVTAAFSPDGNFLATAGFDHDVKIWDAHSGIEILKYREHDGRVYSCEFSPSGKYLLTASDDRTAKVWNVSTGKTLATLKGHDGAIHSATFSNDGQRVATASVDGSVRLWQLPESTSPYHPANDANEATHYKKEFRNGQFDITTLDGRYYSEHNIHCI